MQQQHVGRWVTRDGYIKKELFADGKFDEARGERKNISGGNYTIKGNKIIYSNGNGHRAEADLSNGLMYERGYIFYPESCMTSNPLHKQVCVL